MQIYVTLSPIPRLKLKLAMNRSIECKIIDEVLMGNINYYRELVDFYGEIIFALIYKMVGNREDAEEIAQDVFVKAFQSLKRYRKESSFSTYLYRIAYNLSISHLRKKRCIVYSDDIEMLIKGSESDTLEDLELKILREEQYEKLYLAIDRLNSDEKFLIISFYEDGKSIKELAEITNQSESNIKIKLFRGRKKISLLMEQNKETSFKDNRYEYE